MTVFYGEIHECIAIDQSPVISPCVAEGARVHCTHTGEAGRVSDSGRSGNDRRLDGRPPELSQIQSTDAAVNVPYRALYEVSLYNAFTYTWGEVTSQ